MLRTNKKEVNFKLLKINWLFFNLNLENNNKPNKLHNNLHRQIWIHSRHRQIDILTTMPIPYRLEQLKIWQHHIIEHLNTQSSQILQLK